MKAGYSEQWCIQLYLLRQLGAKEHQITSTTKKQGKRAHQDADTYDNLSGYLSKRTSELMLPYLHAKRKGNHCKIKAYTRNSELVRFKTTIIQRHKTFSPKYQNF
jgi:hypothetical protein